jgi:NADPH-dependent 7-cyano-7-deazaguanine reductase QueF-like protein
MAIELPSQLILRCSGRRRQRRKLVCASAIQLFFSVAVIAWIAYEIVTANARANPVVACSADHRGLCISLANTAGSDVSQNLILHSNRQLYPRLVVFAQHVCWSR